MRSSLEGTLEQLEKETEVSSTYVFHAVINSTLRTF